MGNITSNTARIVKYSVQHLVRTPWQSLAVVLILSITFLIGQIFFATSVASDRVLTYLENQPQVTVFFKNEAQEDQIQQIKTELEKDPLITEVTYISKEQAVEIYKNRYEDQPELTEFVTPDILPASLEIGSSQVTHLSNVASQFRDNQFVETVLFQQDLVDEILKWTNALRTVGIVLVGTLAFISVILMWVVISNTIGSFSREIEIMRLVGAGSWFVRLPFLLDAVIFALFASTISTGILYQIMPYMHDIIINFIGVGDLQPLAGVNPIQVGLYAFVLGAMFTIIVSYAATWSHTKK